jgi:hypothetical protein
MKRRHPHTVSPPSFGGRIIEERSDKREESVMQRMGEVFIPLAIAFMLLFALNVSGLA